MTTLETVVTAVETLGTAAAFIGWLSTVFLFVLK